MPDSIAQSRVAALRGAMGKHGLDALLLLSGPNLSYFSGYPSVERTPARPFFLLVPEHGDLALVVHSGRAFEARRFSWVGDVRVYTRLGVPPAEELGRLLLDRGLGDSAVGMELSRELRLDLDYLGFEEFRAALAPARVVDGSPAIWEARMRKSPDEIEAIRSACEHTSAAYELTFSSLEPGMTEESARRVMLAQLASRAGNGWAVITSGAGNYDLATGPGTSRELEPGDMVWLDAGCSMSGFCSDFSRAAVIGGPSPEQLDAQAVISAITRHAVSLAVPGAPVSEIAAFCEEAIGQLRLPLTSSVSGLAGRVGHGLGLSTTEPPSLSLDDDAVLEAGMVVTIEPGFATDFGIFHVEQNVVVTGGGPNVLSTSSWELGATSVRQSSKSPSDKSRARGESPGAQ
ncbi:MAG: family metallopeptidase [Acidimicrobiaceae bacterium]|nr:family metallopeptidase [Acidimicrobiaceae bacterium]